MLRRVLSRIPLSIVHFSCQNRRFYAAAGTMVPRISLTEKEATLRTLLLDVGQYLSETEHIPKPQLRFTGGWVRDKLLGAESHDIDVGIDSMTGERFALGMKRFLEDRERSQKYDEGLVRKIAKIEANPDKSKHLETATTNVLGLDIDLVNLRKETYTKDSRNPQIEPATPEEDALRRDATVNALFYNLQTEEVEDFTHRGIEDMQKKIIRTPLEPYQTFEDDPLRILRCIRFATRLGYNIDSKALACMDDRGIAESLRIKISRERIGVEIEKTLRGPDPRAALEIIEAQNLYETIFANPQRADVRPEYTANWSRVRNVLHRLVHDKLDPQLSPIQNIAITSKDDEYVAWMMAALLPWGQNNWPERLKLTSKGTRIYPAAAVAAREGLKLDNKVLEDIIKAVDCFDEVTSLVSQYFPDHTTFGATQASQALSDTDVDLRESYGMAIRHWGPHWRSIVLYTLLAFVQQNAEPAPYLEAFAKWLTRLKELNLLEAYALKPIVNGGELKKAMGRQSGEWLAGALERVIRWQLRNPQSQDKNRCIDDIKAYI